MTVQRNRYSVPSHLANHKVVAHLYPGHIEAYADNALVACHARLLDRDQVSDDWQHYIPLIERKPGALRNGAPFIDMPVPLAKLQAALRRRERQQGDRIMAKVLAAVSGHGLETVLVGVELVQESGVHSGEHVLNVLARLSQARTPEQVETSLTLTEEPLADTSRYDSLNARRRLMSDITSQLKALKLHGMADGYMESSEWLPRHLLEAESTDRAIRSIRYQLPATRFPVHRDLAGFDFSQSKVDESLITRLATMEFTDAAQNVVLVGGTGTGKTHLMWRARLKNHNRRLRSVLPASSTTAGVFVTTPPWNGSIRWNERRPRANRASWRSA